MSTISTSQFQQPVNPNSLGRAWECCLGEPVVPRASWVIREEEEDQMTLENAAAKDLFEQLNVRIAGLEARLDKELGDLKATIHDSTVAQQGFQAASSAASEAQVIEPPPVSLSRLELERLDESFENAYELQTSMWDCCVLFGFGCVRRADQFMVALGALVNGALQILFSIAIQENLANNPFDTDNLLDGAKSWRASVAHDVMNANAITQVSLASEVCEGSSGLPFSAMQTRLYDNLDSYLNPPVGSITTLLGTTMEFLNGKLLSRLALLLFLWCLLRDMLNNYRLALALWSQPKGRASLLIDGKSDVTIGSVSYMQVLFVTFFAILPRLAVEMALCAAGSRYIVYTVDLGDLVLNALALVFILDVDELSYEVLAPHRVKVLLLKIGSIQVNSKSFHMKVTAINIPVAISLVGSVVAVLVVNVFIIEPFEEQIKDAHFWLCGGNKDFVYSMNKANGVLTFTESQDFDGKFAPSFQEMAVLNFAGLVADTSTLGPLATVAKTASWQNLSVGTWSQVSRIAMGGTEYSASGMAGYSTSFCINLLDDLWAQADHIGVDESLIVSTIERLEKLVVVTRYVLQLEMGNSSVASCADIPDDVCLQGSLAGTYARNSCPLTCGCRDPHFGNAYATNHFGCPSGCSWFWDYQATRFYDMVRDPDQPCQDLSVEKVTQWQGFYNWIESKQRFYRSLGWPDSELELAKGQLLKSGCRYLNPARAECAVGTKSGRSLRLLCPASCGCSMPGVPDKSECPPACVSNLVNYSATPWSEDGFE